MKKPADEIILAKSVLFFHDPKDFDSSNGMLDLDACPGYFCISRLLFLGEFFSLRLLCQLYHSNVIGPIPLVADILLKDAFIREGIHFIGDMLVVHLPLHSKTGKEAKSCHTGDYDILDGVFLLFAAVMLLLKVRVGGTGCFPFSAVMDKLVDNKFSATFIKKKSTEGDHVGCGKHSRIIDCIAEYLRQRMFPLLALLLAHVKAGRVIVLDRVVLKIDKYEEQPVGNSWKRTV